MDDSHIIKPSHIDAQLKEELASVLLACNEARRVVTSPSTHPDNHPNKDINGHDDLDFEYARTLNISNNIRTRRNDPRGQLKQFLTTLDSRKHRDVALNYSDNLFYSALRRSATQNTITSSLAFAVSAFAYLKITDNKMPIHIVECLNTDVNKKVDNKSKYKHVLLVVLNNAEGPANDKNNWKIIVDACSGTIIADKTKFAELKVFHRYEKSDGELVNLLVHYNPNFHYFKELHMDERQDNAIDKLSIPENITAKKTAQIKMAIGMGLLAFTSYHIAKALAPEEDFTERLGM